MRRAPVVMLLLLLSACGGDPLIPEEDLSIALTPASLLVSPGETFELTVVRVWRKDLRPDAFPDHLLSPLVVKLLETRRREDDHRVVETRRYRAAAVSLEDFTVPAPVLRARASSEQEYRTASGNPVAVTIKRRLDPADPGAAEYPDGPLVGESSWLLPAALCILFCAGLVTALLYTRLRSRREVPPVHTPGPEAPRPPVPHEVALRHIARLQGTPPKDSEEMAAQHEEASLIMRGFLAAGLGMRAIEMTTEECLASSEVAGARTILGASLSRCDLVKFAGWAPTEEERERMLSAAEGFVRQISSSEGGE